MMAPIQTSVASIPPIKPLLMACPVQTPKKSGVQSPSASDSPQFLGRGAEVAVYKVKYKDEWAVMKTGNREGVNFASEVEALNKLNATGFFSGEIPEVLSVTK